MALVGSIAFEQLHNHPVQWQGGNNCTTGVRMCSDVTALQACPVHCSIYGQPLSDQRHITLCVALQRVDSLGNVSHDGKVPPMNAKAQAGQGMRS